MPKGGNAKVLAQSGIIDAVQERRAINVIVEHLLRKRSEWWKLATRPICNVANRFYLKVALDFSATPGPWVYIHDVVDEVSPAYASEVASVDLRVDVGVKSEVRR